MGGAQGTVSLRPGAAVLRRGVGDVQIGTDPRWSVRLVGLTESEEAWLRDARPGVALPAVTPLVRDLFDVLRDAKLVVPSGHRSRAAVTAPASGAADTAVLSALRPDGAGRLTLDRRARAVVAVSGLGRLGIALAGTLGTAGVGTLLLDDQRPVLVNDVAHSAYRSGDVGTTREVAARRIIGSTSPAVRTTSCTGPDVVVVVERHVADPRRVRELMGHGTTHLSVVFREADVVVGPFVTPGITPCLTCLDLDCADRDPSWPQVGQQLRDLPDTGCEETVLATTGAAIAAGQVLTALDGLTPRAAAACIEVAVPDAVPRLREIRRHPRCGCADLDVSPNGADVGTSGRRGR